MPTVLRVERFFVNFITQREQGVIAFQSVQLSLCRYHSCAVNIRPNSPHNLSSKAGRSLGESSFANSRRLFILLHVAFCLARACQRSPDRFIKTSHNPRISAHVSTRLIFQETVRHGEHDGTSIFSIPDDMVLFYCSLVYPCPVGVLHGKYFTQLIKTFFCVRF